ncbi:MAG: hypothetical protein FWD22_00280 [Treponema sp.]|nr:hypothetical protein [Treponema sp.]
MSIKNIDINFQKITVVFLTAIFLMVLVSKAETQIIHEPNSIIYKDIDLWIAKGFVRSHLPAIRPYPAPLIDFILDEVIENGDEAAAEKATQYKDYFAPGNRIIRPGLSAYFQGKDDEYGFFGSAFAEGLFRITDLFATSYHLAFYGMTDPDGERFNVPGTYSPYPDIIKDTSNVGKIEIRQNWTSLSTVGTKDVYLQAGLTRSSFGPFFDNGLVIGPQAPRAGHISFAFLRQQWAYEMLFQMITATDDFGLGHYPGKYNIVHNLSFRPFDSLELGAIQSMVYGERIELLYLVPFNFLFASESIYDFSDNAQMGLYFKWRLFDAVDFKGLAFVDDFHFNNLISSGTLQAKAAGQMGITWAPKSGFLSKLDFDYTGVLPYCYTHWNQDDDYRYNGYDGSDLDIYKNPTDPSKPDNQLRKPNYLNYTHIGRNIGPDLEPNSDRISLRTLWDIVPSVRLNINGYFTRHGNASEGREKMDPNVHDGSIFDDGCSDPWPDPDGEPFEEGRSRKQTYGFDYWLTQDVLDKRLGGTIGVMWTIQSFPFGIFRLIGEYGAEYGWNRGLVKDRNSLDNFWNIGFLWSW